MRAGETFYEKVAETYAQEADEWKLEHETAALVHRIENYVRCFTPLLDSLIGWKKDLFRKLFAGQIDDQQEIGRVLEAVLSRICGLKNLTINAIQAAEGEGYEVEGSEAFMAAGDRLERETADLRKRWPFMTLDDIERGREDMRCGRYSVAEDFVRELEGEAR